MVCPKCGNEVPDGVPFCGNCGANMNQQPPKQETQPVQQVIVQQTPITKDTLPEKFRPLSAWAYFGYSILFSIPIVGFIFLIIYTFNGRNINRRSFARSYWCWLIIAAIVIAILFATGVGVTLMQNLKN